MIAEVFHAKAFRVTYTWQPRVYASQPLAHFFTADFVSSDNSTSALSSPSQINSFLVPSDDEDGAESDRDSSRESSIQVVESNVRATYRVPMNFASESESDLDDEVEEISSSPSVLKAETSSNITTPEKGLVHERNELPDLFRPESSSDKSTELKLKGPCLQDIITKTSIQGSSQIHPINIEADEQNMQTETGDERSNSLASVQPTSKTSVACTGGKRSDIADLLNDRPPSTISAQMHFAYQDPDDLRSNEDAMNASTTATAGYDDPFPPDMEEANDHDFAAFVGSYDEADSGERAPSPSDAVFAKNYMKSFQRSTPNVTLPSCATVFGRPSNATPLEAYPRTNDGARDSLKSLFGDLKEALHPPSGHQPPDVGTYAAHHERLAQSGQARQRLCCDGTASNTHPPSDVLEEHSFKPAISNLINAVPEEERKSLKRKADFISIANPVARVPHTYSSPLADSEGASLQDAQRPDAPLPSQTDAIAFGSGSINSLSGSISRLNTSLAPPVESPRKKKKTTWTSGGVGKFASGLVVGAVGAVVAFVATIPAEVREEAIREL